LVHHFEVEIRKILKKITFFWFSLKQNDDLVPYKGMKTILTTSNDVRYAGEFVLTREGNLDFGEISEEIAQKIHRQAGKIRLRIGRQEPGKDNYGEKHIKRPDRLKELFKNGYINVCDFVQEVASEYTAIYSGENGRLTLYKKTDRKGIAVFIILMVSTEGDFYDVKTGMIVRDSYFRNKKPLWEKSQSG